MIFSKIRKSSPGFERRISTCCLHLVAWLPGRGPNVSLSSRSICVPFSAPFRVRHVLKEVGSYLFHFASPAMEHVAPGVRRPSKALWLELRKERCNLTKRRTHEGFCLFNRPVAASTGSKAIPAQVHASANRFRRLRFELLRAKRAREHGPTASLSAHSLLFS